MSGGWAMRKEKKNKANKCSQHYRSPFSGIYSLKWYRSLRCMSSTFFFNRVPEWFISHESWTNVFTLFYRSLFVICLLFLGKFPSSQSLFMVGCVCVQFRHKAPIAFLAMGAADRSQMKESCTWNLLLGAMNSTRVRRETSEKVSNFSVFIFGYRLPLESHSMREEMCYRMSSSTLGMRKITATF